MENSSDTAASIIENLGNYQWSGQRIQLAVRRACSALTQMVIYQMHLKTFMFRNDGVPYAYGKLFRTLVEKKLDYLQQLGINAICFMPLNEFPGDTSWGYNPANWFALESSYGTPSDFQYMVDECHKRASP
jgi:1,4-alpha-glucan branching enzyme